MMEWIGAAGVFGLAGLLPWLRRRSEPDAGAMKAQLDPADTKLSRFAPESLAYSPMAPTVEQSLAGWIQHYSSLPTPGPDEPFINPLYAERKMGSLSSLNDSTILRETTFSVPDEKGRVNLRFKLPSGRTVVSTDRLVPNAIQGKVLIAWAEAIRAEDESDIKARGDAERLAAVEKRARALLLPAPTDSAPAQRQPSSECKPGSPSMETAFAATSPASSMLLPDDPIGLIEEKLRVLRIEATKAEAQLDAVSTHLASVRGSIGRWEAVLSMLRTSTVPSVTEPLGPSSSPIEVLPEPSPPPQARTPRKQRKSRSKVPAKVEVQYGIEQPLAGSGAAGLLSAAEAEAFFKDKDVNA